MGIAFCVFFLFAALVFCQTTRYQLRRGDNKLHYQYLDLFGRWRDDPSRDIQL